MEIPKNGFPTLKKGVVTVGTYFTNPPFEFLQDGKRVGLEFDLLNILCQRLHLKCEFVDTTWEGILHRLENNEYDAIVGGITITPERAETLNFTVPYMITTLSLIIDPQKTPDIRAMKDLNDKIVGVQAETTGYDIAEKMLREKKIGNLKVYPFAKIEEGLTDLEKGRIHAFIKVFPVAYHHVQHRPHLKIAAQIPNEPQPLGIGFNKKSTLLLKAFNQAQKEILADGTYQALYTKWF